MNMITHKVLGLSIYIDVAVSSYPMISVLLHTWNYKPTATVDSNVCAYKFMTHWKLTVQREIFFKLSINFEVD